MSPLRTMHLRTRSLVMESVMERFCGEIEQSQLDGGYDYIQPLPIYLDSGVRDDLYGAAEVCDRQGNRLAHRFLDFDGFLHPGLESGRLYPQAIGTSRKPDIGAAVCVCGHIARRSSPLVSRPDSSLWNNRPTLVSDHHRKNDLRRCLGDPYRGKDCECDHADTCNGHARHVSTNSSRAEPNEAPEDVTA